jgi:hypothetical protein
VLTDDTILTLRQAQLSSFDRDGWIGLILGLDVIGAVESLEEYFRDFLAI